MDVWCCLFLFVTVFHGCRARTAEEWRTIAQRELLASLGIKPNTNVAKNVILFIGDGMGLPSITGARFYKQQLDNTADRPYLSFEQFPAVGLSKTDNNDRQTAGSASTGTAYLCGSKANYGTIGVSPSVLRKDCATSKTPAGKVYSIHKWSEEAGKSTGFVTTARVTHASPAAGYAHSADRNWEGTTEVDPGCQDIASQLFDNQNFKVIMGGGRRYILMNNQTDPETGSIHSKQRTDGRDLIKEWEAKTGGKYVYNKGQFDAVDPATTDHLLGLFSPSHMAYEVERDDTPEGEPSIADMTRKAIQILQKNDKGFFLFVEAARIDHGHHNNTAKRALHEVLTLDEAVETAMTMTDEKETLIVVSADHSHVFSIAGYPSQGNDLFGLVDIVPEEEGPYDKMPYTTLIYGNGPGPGRINLTGVDTTHIDFKQPAAVQMIDDTHGAEDVPIYARGPMSHLFTGVHEQNFIPHAMAYASCVGSNKDHCDDAKEDDPCVGAGATVTFSYLLIIATCLLIV